ncbi:hypothetical protein ACM9XD_20445 [Xanthomonas sacchari]
MMRVEFRDNFKGGDALVIMAGAKGLLSLGHAICAWSKHPKEVCVSSLVKNYSGVEIFLLRGGGPGLASAYETPSGVFWAIGKDAATRFGGMIVELSSYPGAAHIYLDFEGYARTVIVSMDEY